MILGFFKRGVYAERVRAIIAEMNVISMEGVNDTSGTVGATTSVLKIVLGRTGFAAVEYESFGYLTSTSVSASWRVEVLEPGGAVLVTTHVQVVGSFGQTWQIPWYVRGRHESPDTSSVGYRTRVTLISGGGNMRFLSARLYGVR